MKQICFREFELSGRGQGWKPWKSNVRIGHGRHIQNIVSPLIDLQARSVLLAFKHLIQLKKANRCLGVGVLFMKLLPPCSHKIGQSVRRSESDKNLCIRHWFRLQSENWSGSEHAGRKGLNLAMPRNKAQDRTKPFRHVLRAWDRQD